MKLTLNNFLMGIKEIVMGGGRQADGNPRNDSGYLVDNHELMDSSVLAASVTYITDANGFPALNAAAGITAVANVPLVVPRDYDEATDVLRLRIVASMAGATDTPTLTIAAKKKTVNAAAAVITPVSGTPTAALSSATEQAFELEFRGQGLLRNQMLEFTITSGAHATDALRINQIGVAYRSCLVSYHETDGTRDGKDGNKLR